MPFAPVDGDENNFHHATGANSIDCVASQLLFPPPEEPHLTGVMI